MSHIIITGGAGFIGCNLAKYYMSNNHEVTLFDNFSRKGSRDNAKWVSSQFPQVKVVQGDITNPSQLQELFETNSDAVFHLAGQVAVTTSVQQPQFDFLVNAQGTINVLEAIRKSSSDPVFIYSSTNKVYGGMEHIDVVEDEHQFKYKDIDGVPEDLGLDFHSPYGCSKGSADQYTRDYARIFGMNTSVFRQSCIYGQRQFGIEDQGWVAWFVIQSLLGNKINIYGNGKQVRDLLYMDDLADAFELAVKHKDKTKGQIYNIGGGPANQISLLQALKKIEELLGKKIDLSFSDARPGDQKVYVSNISKAKKDFGWEPKINPDQGIKKLFEWVSDNIELFKK